MLLFLLSSSTGEVGIKFQGTRVNGDDYGLNSLTGAKVLYIYRSRYDTPDRLRTLGATVYEVSVYSIGTITPDSLCNYDFVMVDIGAVNSLGFLSASLQSYVFMGGGYWVNQPNQTGSVATLPPGFSVYVSSIWYGCGNSTCQIPTPAYSTHPITSGMPIDWTSGDYDTESSWGSSWTVLIMDQGPALMAGTYGAGRLVYTDHCFSWTCIDPGDNRYLDRIGSWLAAGSCGPLSSSDELIVEERKSDIEVDIRVDYGGIWINASSKMVKIYTIDGKSVFKGIVNGKRFINLNRGVYYLKIGNEPRVVVIR